MSSLPDDRQSAASPASPEDRFDDALRRQLTDFEVTPTPTAWPTLRAQLGARVPTPAGVRWRQAATTFSGGLLVGALLWWGAGRVITPAAAPFAADRSVVEPNPTEPVVSAAAPAPSAVLNDALKTGAAERPARTPKPAHPTTAEPVTLLKHRPAAVAKVVAGTRPQPHPLRPVVSAMRLTEVTGAAKPVVRPVDAEPAHAAITSFVLLSGVESRDSLIRQRALAYRRPAAAPDTLRTAKLRVLVDEQTRALATLQARLDSVKQFMRTDAAAPKRK